MSLPEKAELLERADGLAGESHWGELHALLAAVPQSTLFGSSALAYRMGEALYHTGRMEDLARYADELEPAMRRSRRTSGLMRALNLAGIAAFELGRMDTARRRFEELLELAQGEDDPDMLARATNNLGALANLEGRHEDALGMYRLAIPLYQRLGQTRGLAQTHQNLGISYRDLGRLEEAAAAYRKAAELGRGFGYTPIVAMAMVGRAEIEVLGGDPDLGAGFVEWGLVLARQLEDPITEGNALRVRALVRVSRESGYDEAAEDLERALELARRTGNVLLEAEVERDLGRLALLRGRDSEARERLSTARDLLAGLGAQRAARTLDEEIGD